MLSEAQRAFLSEKRYAVVGTLNTDGSIQQTVVWFILEGDEIYFGLGANSIKARNLRRNTNVTITIEDGTRYLTLSGRAALEASDAALRRRIAERYLDPERVDAWLARRPDAPRASVRVSIARVYGQGIK